MPFFTRRAGTSFGIAGCSRFEIAQDKYVRKFLFGTMEQWKKRKNEYYTRKRAPNRDPWSRLVFFVAIVDVFPLSMRCRSNTPITESELANRGSNLPGRGTRKSCPSSRDWRTIRRFRDPGAGRLFGFPPCPSPPAPTPVRIPG